MTKAGEMKSRSRKRILLAGLLASALAFVATPAFAGTTYSSFNTTIPNLQQPRFVGSQAKVQSNVSGNVTIYSVGSDYTVNVRMRQTGTLNYGTEVYGLGDGASSGLPNSFSAGTNTGVSIVNSAWALVSVSVSGAYRTM